MTSDWMYHRPEWIGDAPPELGLGLVPQGYEVEYRGIGEGQWRRGHSPGYLRGYEYRYRRIGNQEAFDQQPLPENPKAIYGRAKPSLGLIPSAAMVEEAAVLQLGADKYGPFNWRKDAVESMTYVHATLRHLFSWLDGEDLDPESRSSHLAHARACLGIVLDAKALGKLIDDRPHGGAASRLIAEHTKPISL